MTCWASTTGGLALLGQYHWPSLPRFCYHSIFTCGDVAAYSQCVWGKFQGDIPTWQRSLLALLAPVFQLFVSTKLAVTKEEAERSLKEATNICREVRGGTCHLLGGRVAV